MTWPKNSKTEPEFKSDFMIPNPDVISPGHTTFISYTKHYAKKKNLPPQKQTNKKHTHTQQNDYSTMPKTAVYIYIDL